MSARFFLAAALLLAATVARAEVRVVRGSGGPELSVHPATGGVWTPLAPLDASIVNPGGDLIGDGYPGQATGRGKLVAAWQRPSSSNLVILRAAAPNSYSLEELAVSPEGGVPAVATSDRAWLIAWQAGIDNPEVIVVTGSDSEIGDPTPIVRGELVGAFKVGAAVHVVTAQADDTLLAWRTGQSLLGRVLLETDGVDAAGAFVRAPNGSCQAILNAAGRN